MRKVWSAAAVMAAFASGCATTEKVARFEVQSPAAASTAVAQATAEQAHAHERSLGGCIDELADRFATRSRLAVRLELQINNAKVELVDVHSGNPATVVDGELRSCLAQSVKEIALANHEGSAIVELSVLVQPHPVTRPAGWRYATTTAPNFRATE